MRLSQCRAKCLFLEPKFILSNWRQSCSPGRAPRPKYRGPKGPSGGDGLGGGTEAEDQPARTPGQGDPTARIIESEGGSKREVESCAKQRSKGAFFNSIPLALPSPCSVCLYGER